MDLFSFNCFYLDFQTRIQKQSTKRSEMGRWTASLSIVVVLVLVCLTTCHAQRVNHCLAADVSSCSKCLQVGVGCAYCTDEVRSAFACICRHPNEKINTRLNVAQVAPQLMKMSLSPGEEKEVEMEIFEPEKGPLDLYILMDFSNSMQDDLDNLKKMGAELARLVEDLSNDYTIGFGKFVDKVTEPQTDMRPSKLKQPWPNSDPPFSFQNTIPLTSNITLFGEKLQEERISGNLDAPEGGFDAILQTAVCQSQIGWRKDTTHLLVFSTESAFHYEADGANVLAGILKRNDEQCHLTRQGVYTHDRVQDYPSVPTLVRLLGKHNIIPIFAVTNHSYSYYEKLYRYFPIAEIGVLQEDSSNILSILRSAFTNIRSKISLRAEDRPRAVETQFIYSSGASNQDGTFRNEPGHKGTFKMRVKAHSKMGEDHVCSLPENDRNGTMRVKPTTFSAHLGVTTEVLCPICNCEKNRIKNAQRCHSNGDLTCGRCHCHSGWLGPFCNCSAAVSSSDTQSCVAPGSKSHCSDRGDCLCGTCICYDPQQYEGPYCQYDKTQCSRFGGFLCNDRGRCYMGGCVCEAGWDGEACECPKSNQTCLDSKGVRAASIAQLGICEAKRSCVQCQAWKTGDLKGEKCKACPFKITMVDELKESDNVIENCSFRDEEDDCTYHYSVEYPTNPTDTTGEVQVLKKKDCPPGGFLWLIPLIMFLMLLLGLLLLCCWKYCACCKFRSTHLTLFIQLHTLSAGRMVGFKEDQYMFRQSSLTSNHLDTPLVRTGPPKSTDVVRWKITDNVHRSASLAQMVPNQKETVHFPLSLRLSRLFTESLSRPEARDTEALRREVEDNLNEVYKQIPGAQKVKKTIFRQNLTVVDTVLSAPRAAYPDIVDLTEKNVQSGNFSNLKVVPGYYTVATDREATGAVEMQEGVECVDVRVPLFVKDEDDDKKQLRAELIDVPLGIAEIGRRFVNITIIKEHAKSVLTFLQPSYTYSRQDKVAKIPVCREIIEDGHTQVTYRTRDLTAKDQKDYISVEGDLSYQPGETQKVVPVKLLELGEADSLLSDKQVKQFVMDLSNPRQGAKLGRYPRTTVTIADEPEPSVMMFQKSTQNFTTTDKEYSIPVVRTRNQDSSATVQWKTHKASRFDLSGQLKFAPGETEKNVVIKPHAYPEAIKPETFQLELQDPSSNAVIGERKTTLVNISDPGEHSHNYQDWYRHITSDKMQVDYVTQALQSPGGRLCSPSNIKATATGPKSIRLNWSAPQGNPQGYKVKYWIQGDPEADARVVDCKTTQTELTNLYPYCDYEMRVCSFNALGNGAYSDIVQCQTLEDVPSEPGRLAFNVISPTVTQLSWAEPAETNGIITAYEVNYTPIDEDNKSMGPTKKVRIDNPKKRMLLIENLQPSQTYQYNVRACNSVGWGPYREATINLATQPNRPMSIPIIPDIPIVDAEAGEGYDSFLMYSSDVLRSPGGRPSVSDEDQFMNGKWEQNLLYPGASGSLTRNLSTSSSSYPQLSPHSQHSSNVHGMGGTTTIETTTTYLQGNSLSRRQEMTTIGGLRSEEVTMRKRSDNRAYYDSDGVRDSIVMVDMPGGFSGSLDPRFTPGVPETPSRLVFSALGPTALKVSWQEPHCERDVLGYCVLYQLLNGGDMKRIDVPGNGDNSVVVQDLLPNQSYIFKVKAQSQEGWGPEREGVITIESAVDPRSPLSPVPGSPFTLSTPSAPGPLVFTALSPDALQLSWDKPRKPNGDILGYVVTCEQLHGGGDMRSFQVSGDGAETSLTVSDLAENVPYKFKVQARTTQGFGPEREGIITIESQDGGNMSQYNSQCMTRRDVFHLPGEMSTHTNITHTTFDDPFFKDGMMVTTQHTETSGSVTRQITKEMVTRTMMSGASSTAKMVERFYEK
ncbi:integrin beta-4 isoform X1 [Arapaima gigas]